MQKQYKVLFVCMGNICRSPAAECVMNHFVEKEGLLETILCDSAGTTGFHRGASPDSRMRAAGQARGIAIQGAARQIQPEDLEKFDLILAMDRENIEEINRLDHQSIYREKIQLFCAYCREHDVKEVPDPYYERQEGFKYVLDLLEDGCRNLLQDVRNKCIQEKK